MLENWKSLEQDSNSDTSCNRRALYSHQRIDTGTGGLGNKREGGDSLNYSIIEIRQNLRKSPGDLRRLALSHTPVKNNQVTLVWKTHKWVKSQSYKDVIYALNDKRKLIITASNNYYSIRIKYKTTKSRKQKLVEKQLDGYFTRRNGKIAQESKLTWLRKEILKRENESLFYSSTK